MSDREEKIRARAHELWLAEGQPEGRADHHWATAEAEIGIDAPVKAKRAPRKPKAEKVEAAPVEAAPKKPARAAKAKTPKLKVVSDRGAAA
jgi:hypothetical protein